MAYETILYDREGPAAIITFNRPEKHNALSMLLIREVVDALEKADVDPDVRGVIITGNERAFSTGADMNDSLGVSSVPDTFRYLAAQRKLTAAAQDLSKPVIAAISGYCITGGLEFALACDIRLAAENATFGITSSKIGGSAGLGGTQRLPRLVGPARAKELMFTSSFIDAREADRIGLVNRVVPVGHVIPEAKKLVACIAEMAPVSIWLMKRAVNVGGNMDMESALYFEAQCTSLAFQTQDRTEGFRAFLEKRPVKFKGV